MEEKKGRLTENIEEPPEVDISNKAEYKNITKKIIVISVIIALIAAVIIIVLITTSSEDSDEKEEENKDNKDNKDAAPYNPIPEKEDLDFTEEAHRLLEREIAAQTMVLATNNEILPLNPTDQVVLFGKGTNKTIYGGWGSGEVYNKGSTGSLTPIMILEGFQKQKDKNKYIYVENEIGYELGSGFDPKRPLTEEDIKKYAVKKDNAKRSIAVLTISRRSGEGSDRQQNWGESGTLLNQNEINTYKALKKYFDKIVMVLNVGSVIELQDIEKDVNVSILIAYLPGMEAGNAVVDVLVGDVNPSGHLTDTWAKYINDYPTTSTFKESIKYVRYSEGLFVGYRYFEDNEETQKKVVFPFGHGLSYTTFSIESNCVFDPDKKIFTVTSKVTNTGKRAGRQVVQVYVKKPQNSDFIKVQRELVAFNKTKELQQGESQDLTMTFDLYYLASYDDTGATGNPGCYVLEKGFYYIYVGDSVKATRDSKSLIYTHIQKEFIITQKLTNRLIPKDPELPDPNIKPDFSKLFFTNNNNNENNKNEECFKNEMINIERLNTDNILQNEYTNLPTDKFNEINFKSVLEQKYTMDQLVDSMTNEELAFLSYGKDATVRSGTGIIGGFYNSGPTAKYNIPYGDTMDGPAGLRQSEVKMGSTGWPCSTALASTFDVEIMKLVGEETGKEARKIGTSFWLAPGMNIHRSPLCGRNFEYYSEDPLLTGKMAAAISQGLQSKRVSITLKHFAFNDKEENRNGDSDSPTYLASDSRVAERVAREIYLKGFEIAVKEGNPWAIMSSYNRMNSMKTAESYDLLTEILRNEWGFEGLVMTDWGTRSHNDVEAHGGSSVKMPNNGNEGSNTILTGLTKGTVTRDELKRNIKYMFKTLAKTAAIDSLFKEPENRVKITSNTMRIKIYDNIYRKSVGISYENCEDDDGGYNPTNTNTNRWITIYVENDVEQYRQVRLRFSSILEGFGIEFKKYDEHLGEITNLENTSGWQKWKSSSYTTVKFPKGKYELTLRFLGFSYSGESESKGNINWIEIK